MKIEIERKFLVDIAKLPKLPQPKRLDQFYISFKPSTRIRCVSSINEDEKCYLTIKGRGSISRLEYEYEIPVDDFVSFKNMKQGNIVSKHRYEIKVGTFLWEVDEFLGPLKGLWVAEIELLEEDEKFTKPDWLLEEISLDKRYSNSSLAERGLP